jgi:hypothetical protein
MDKKRKDKLIAKSQDRISTSEYSILIKKKEEQEKMNRKFNEQRMKEDFKYNNLRIIESKSKEIVVFSINLGR